MNGRIYQQSANTESKREALGELKTQILKHSNGEAADNRRITVAALSESMIQTWKQMDKNPATVKWVERCWKKLDPYFGKMKANSLSSAGIRGYVEYRKNKGAAN